VLCCVVLCCSVRALVRGSSLSSTARFLGRIRPSASSPLNPSSSEVYRHRQCVCLQLVAAGGRLQIMDKVGFM